MRKWRRRGPPGSSIELMDTETLMELQEMFEDLPVHPWTRPIELTLRHRVMTEERLRRMKALNAKLIRDRDQAMARMKRKHISRFPERRDES